MRKLKQKIHAFLEKHPLIAKILTNPDMRTDASLFYAFAMSFFFTLFCLISSFFGNTRWFLTLGVYNFILALLRLFPAMGMRRQIIHPLPAEERVKKDARFCQIIGFLLLILNLAFIGITAETIIRNHAFHYHPLILLFMVPFTVINFILLSVDTIRKRKEGATLSHSIRSINITLALISLYTLQTAILDTYVSHEVLRLVLNLTTSSLIFIAMLRINIHLILAARKVLKQDTDHAQ